jgi:hypothetical protein
MSSPWQSEKGWYHIRHLEKIDSLEVAGQGVELLRHNSHDDGHRDQQEKRLDYRRNGSILGRGVYSG